MSHALATLTPITLLFMVRNIKCGYLFSLLEQAEHFETKKLSRFGEIFCLQQTVFHQKGWVIKQLFHVCL